MRTGLPPLPGIPPGDETSVAMVTGFREAYEALRTNVVIPRIRARLDDLPPATTPRRRVRTQADEALAQDDIAARTALAREFASDNLLTDAEWETYILDHVADPIGDSALDGALAAAFAFGVLASDRSVNDATDEQRGGLLDFSSMIRDALENWYRVGQAQGWRGADFERNIERSPLGESRADIAARLHEQSALNSGFHAGLTEIGRIDVNDNPQDEDGDIKVAAFMWITMRDQKVRDAHAAVDRDVVPVGHPFIMVDETGVYEARYPGDPRLPIGLRINCRCLLGWVEGARIRRTLAGTRRELLDRARDLDIRGRHEMSKAELQMAVMRELCLQGLAGGTDCPELLDRMNRNALLTLAREEGITGRHLMTRPQLIEALASNLTPSDALRAARGYAPQAAAAEARRLATARRRTAPAATGPGTLPPVRQRRAMRETVFADFGGMSRGYVPCVHCSLKLSADPGSGLALLVPEPIVPWSAGGTLAAGNLVPACPSCFKAGGGRGVVASAGVVEMACGLHAFRGCQSPACAPPPAGTGGSLPGNGSDGGPSIGAQGPLSLVEGLWANPPAEVLAALAAYVENPAARSNHSDVVGAVAEAMFGDDFHQPGNYDQYVMADVEQIAEILIDRHSGLDHLNFELTETAEHFGTTKNELEAAITQGLAETLAAAPVSIRVTHEVLADVLADDRFKNLYETGRGFGWNDQELRRWGEYRLFGIDPEAGYPFDKAVPPGDRPIYGYMDVDGNNGRVMGDEDSTAAAYYSSAALERAQSLDQYGGIRVELTDAVRDRTSFTFGDSLGEWARPSPITAPEVRSMGNKYDGFGRIRANENGLDMDATSDLFWNTGRYVEAQVHGGVSAADIARVTFPLSPPVNSPRYNNWLTNRSSWPPPELTLSLDARGIEWGVVEVVPPGIVAGYPDEPWPPGEGMAASAGKPGGVIYIDSSGATITKIGKVDGQEQGFITRDGVSYPPAPIIGLLAHGYWRPVTS